MFLLANTQKDSRKVPTPPQTVAMAIVGSMTSLGEGHSLWQLRDVGMSKGEEFRVWSPRFSSSGCRYQMRLWKQKDSCLVRVTLFREDSLPLPHLPHRLELRSGEESLSPCTYALTPDGRTCGVSCGVDVGGYFLQRGGSVLLPLLSVSLRTEAEGSSVSRGSQTEGLDSSPRDIEEKKCASRAVQTEVPDSSSRDTDDFANLQTDLEKLVLGERDSDITLKVRGKSFPAHKAILRVRCPVFDAMFEHDMVETQSGSVTIEDCDPNTFPDFLHYLYTGSAEKVGEANVCHIFRDADKYGVLRLRAHCVEFMKSHLSLETFCDFLTVAVRHREGDLVRAATEFFCGNAVEILQSVEWQVFIHENVTVGNELVLKALLRAKTD